MITVVYDCDVCTFTTTRVMNVSWAPEQGILFDLGGGTEVCGNCRDVARRELSVADIDDRRGGEAPDF